MMIRNTPTRIGVHSTISSLMVKFINAFARDTQIDPGIGISEGPNMPPGPRVANIITIRPLSKNSSPVNTKIHPRVCFAFMVWL